jgi:hypothetical protein
MKPIFDCAEPPASQSCRHRSGGAPAGARRRGAAMLRGRAFTRARRPPATHGLLPLGDLERAPSHRCDRKGELFGQIVPRLLGRVGLALFLGALTSVFFSQCCSVARARIGPGLPRRFGDHRRCHRGDARRRCAAAAQASHMRQDWDEFL